MEQLFVFHPKGVCSRTMNIYYEGDTITRLEVEGGCHGNLQGIAALVRGRKITDLIASLHGIDCRGRGTSCPDQLSIALTQLAEHVG